MYRDWRFEGRPRLDIFAAPRLSRGFGRVLMTGLKLAADTNRIQVDFDPSGEDPVIRGLIARRPSDTNISHSPGPQLSHG